MRWGPCEPSSHFPTRKGFTRRHGPRRNLAPARPTDRRPGLRQPGLSGDVSRWGVRGGRARAEGQGGQAGMGTAAMGGVRAAASASEPLRPLIAPARSLARSAPLPRSPGFVLPPGVCSWFRSWCLSCRPATDVERGQTFLRAEWGNACTGLCGVERGKTRTLREDVDGECAACGAGRRCSVLWCFVWKGGGGPTNRRGASASEPKAMDGRTAAGGRGPVAQAWRPPSLRGE